MASVESCTDCLIDNDRRGQTSIHALDTRPVPLLLWSAAARVVGGVDGVGKIGRTNLNLSTSRDLTSTLSQAR